MQCQNTTHLIRVQNFTSMTASSVFHVRTVRAPQSKNTDWYTHKITFYSSFSYSTWYILPCVQSWSLKATILHVPLVTRLLQWLNLYTSCRNLFITHWFSSGVMSRPAERWPSRTRTAHPWLPRIDWQQNTAGYKKEYILNPAWNRFGKHVFMLFLGFQRVQQNVLSRLSCGGVKSADNHRWEK